MLVSNLFFYKLYWNIILITSPAVLIQDIREFIAFIQPVLVTKPNININGFLNWVIAKELRYCYGLFDNARLQEQKAEYQELYNQLNSQLEAPFSVVFSHYIKAPKIYLDYNEVKIRVVHGCLYIDYFAIIKPINFLQRDNND